MKLVSANTVPFASIVQSKFPVARMMAVPVVSKEYETTGTAITRATGNLDWTIKANGTVVADTSFTMSAGETVRIRANYSPENASLDFGLVDSNEKFHYINVTTGSIDKTIEIPENGSYTLVIRNNLSKSVKVTGIVTY